MAQPNTAGLQASDGAGRAADRWRLSGWHQHATGPARLGGAVGGAVGKDTVSRTWHKVQCDWEAWQKRDLPGTTLSA